MTKRIDNKATYKVTTNKGVYFVTLTHLKNDINGGLRYEANIIKNTATGNDNYMTTFCYRFTGHYMGDAGEANWVVNYHENKK